MFDYLIKFIKNDIVFWIFFAVLFIMMGLYMLKKEGIKITIELGETYGNKIIRISGD